MDFVVFPIYTGWVRPDMIATISALPHVLDTDKANLILEVVAPYAPKTLMGGGMFHLSFGALLTGATLKDKFK